MTGFGLDLSSILVSEWEQESSFGEGKRKMSCGSKPRRSIERVLKEVLERGPILAKRPSTKEVW
jgi:hypothetical protein